MIHLLLPPQYYRKEIDLSSLSNGPRKWSTRELWSRTTDISEDPAFMRSQPVSVYNPISDMNYIDMGRWTTIRLSTNTRGNEHILESFTAALEDLNVKLALYEAEGSATIGEAIWEHLDHKLMHLRSSASEPLTSTLSPIVVLPFEVRYQLEVCISRGVLNEFTVTPQFLQKLAAEDSLRARFGLECVVDRDEPVYDPMSIFSHSRAAAHSSHHQSPHHSALVRKAIIIPTTIRFNSAALEASNRVFRKYDQISDRFLRMQFLNEPESGHIASSASSSSRDVWERVRRTLFHGIRIGNRKFEFLAFGNSQMRQAGAYFFCPTDHISCDDIRRWMGRFGHIKNVA